MPCRCDGMEEYTANQLRRELDNVTDMLCRTCASHERMNGYALPPDIARWWKEHQRADEKRAEKEMEDARMRKVRAAALEKLSLMERTALGLPEE